MNALTALVFVLALGGLPAIVATRSWIGIALAPAVVLVLSAVGASVATAAGLSVVGCVLVLAVAVNVAAAHEVRRRWDGFRNGWARIRTHLPGLGPVAWFAVPSVCLLTLFPPRPLAWDARSIWWFHASWFSGGGELVRSALTNPSLRFSHPDYPPGNPAAIAVLWRVARTGEDLLVAQALTAVLTGLTLAGLALLLVHAHRTPGVIAAASVMVVAATHLGDGLAAAGYVDILSASLLVTALAAYVCIDDVRLSVPIGSMALAGAAVTKNEGLVFGALVLVVAVGVARSHRPRTAIAGGLALMPALAWSLIVRTAGGEVGGDLGSRSSLDDFFTRLRIVVPAVVREVYLIGLPALLACAVLAVAVRRRSETSVHSPRLADLAPAAALVVASLGTAAISSIVYAAGVTDLTWWFATSLERVSATPKLFALAGLVSMTDVALRLFDPGARESAQPRGVSGVS